MQKQYSFKNYIIKNHYNPLFDAVASFIKNNLSELNLYSNSVDIDTLRSKDIYLNDMTVEMICINADTQTNDIEFDVIVSAEIAFSQYSNRYGDDEDSSTNWFRINCSATIDGTLQNFGVEFIEPYDKKKSRFERNLSDELVPIISRDNLDFEATVFLKQYFPLSLSFPNKINVMAIAEKMGLTIEYHPITTDCSIFGQIYFHDTTVDNQIVKAKTIRIDPNVTSIRGNGALTNTIMHECLHWHKHRLAFELVRLYNPNLSNLSTTMDEIDGCPQQEKTATDWMELAA